MVVRVVAAHGPLRNTPASSGQVVSHVGAVLKGGLLSARYRSCLGVVAPLAASCSPLRELGTGLSSHCCTCQGPYKQT